MLQIVGLGRTKLLLFGIATGVLITCVVVLNYSSFGVESNLKRHGVTYYRFEGDKLKWLSIANYDVIESGKFKKLLRTASSLDCTPLMKLPNNLNDLSQFEVLEVLDLTNLPVTDDMVKSIPDSITIRVLRVSGTQLTDRSLETLLRIRSLTGIDLRNTDISPEAISILESSGITVLAE